MSLTSVVEVYRSTNAFEKFVSFFLGAVAKKCICSLNRPFVFVLCCSEHLCSSANTKQIKASIANRFVLPIRFYCRASYAMPVCLAVAFYLTKDLFWVMSMVVVQNVGFVSSHTHTHTVGAATKAWPCVQYILPGLSDTSFQNSICISIMKMNFHDCDFDINITIAMPRFRSRYQYHHYISTISISISILLVGFLNFDFKINISDGILQFRFQYQYQNQNSMLSNSISLHFISKYYIMLVSISKIQNVFLSPC